MSQSYRICRQGALMTFVPNRSGPFVLPGGHPVGHPEGRFVAHDATGDRTRVDGCCISALRVIRVFVLDDHHPVRRGIGELIETADDMAVVGEAGTAADALERIRALRPDVAVLDARLPDGSGIDVCKEVTSSVPETNCLILTCFDDQEARSAALAAGATAFLIKEICGINLLDAIRETAAGEAASPL